MGLGPRIEKPDNFAVICLFCLWGLAVITGGSRAVAQDDETHLKISIGIAGDTLGPGAASEILVSFRPGKGFHVNAVPPVGFELDSGSVATLADSVTVPRDTSTGYMDTRMKVRQGFTISPKAVPGPAEIAGTLTYYYCSDVEGWCRRVKLPFSRSVYVR